jgi:hypothetical protein
MRVQPAARCRLSARKRQIDMLPKRIAKLDDQAEALVKIEQWVQDYGEDSDFIRVRVRASNYAARDAVNASPTHAVAPATVIDLDDPSFNGKFNGTTHLNALATDNLAFFDVILNWFDQNVPNPIVATSCPSGNGHTMAFR